MVHVHTCTNYVGTPKHIFNSMNSHGIGNHYILEGEERWRKGGVSEPKDKAVLDSMIFKDSSEDGCLLVWTMYDIMPNAHVYEHI